jgi:hypothetical protein
MANSLETALEQVGSKTNILIASILAVSVLLPFFIHNPFITGPLVNALLIIVLFMSRRETALIVAAVPSLMALAGGLLPFFMAPAVPFIILGNMIFVVTIDAVYRRSPGANAYWRAAFFGAFIKFIFLFLSGRILLLTFYHPQLAVTINALLGYSQLFSALAGSAIAFIVLKKLKRI